MQEGYGNVAAEAGRDIGAGITRAGGIGCAVGVAVLAWSVGDVERGMRRLAADARGQGRAPPCRLGKGVWSADAGAWRGVRWSASWAGRGKCRPKGHAALSRSTSVKPPALPEVADSVSRSVIVSWQDCLGRSEWN